MASILGKYGQAREDGFFKREQAWTLYQHRFLRAHEDGQCTESASFLSKGLSSDAAFRS